MRTGQTNNSGSCLTLSLLGSASFSAVSALAGWFTLLAAGWKASGANVPSNETPVISLEETAILSSVAGFLLPACIQFVWFVTVYANSASNLAIPTTAVAPCFSSTPSSRDLLLGFFPYLLLVSFYLCLKLTLPFQRGDCCLYSSVCYHPIVRCSC